MRLSREVRRESQETPEQTLARLNALSRSAGAPVPYQTPTQSGVGRLRGYYAAKVDQFRDDYEARLNAAALKVGQSGSTSKPTERSESPAHRLARISQRRWRLICTVFWLCVVVLFVVVHRAVDLFWPGSTPDDAMGAALVVAGVATIAFATFGAVRTNRIDPDDRTTLQRALKYLYEHLGES